MRRFAALLTTLALCAGLAAPALAVAPWALDGLCEAESMEMLIAEDMAVLEETVTAEKLAVILAAVSAKLDLLREPAADETAAAGDVTRGGVLTALAAAAAAFNTDELAPVDFLAALDVVRGDQNGDYRLERPCALQEAFLFAQRLVLALYDRAGAGTKGLMWKVENAGNILYLYGTYHVDRDNLYPFHKTVREMITASDAVCFEVDFGDAEGAARFQAMYCYPEGDSLSRHISAELYAGVVAALAPFGYDEATVNSMKSWAVSNALESLANIDETSGTVMATDAYLYSKAICNDKPIQQVESYALQGQLFEGLSEAAVRANLEAGLKLLGEADGEAVGAGVFTSWQAGDADGFAAAYGKDAPPETEADKEMAEALFGRRDPGMADWCETFLTREGAHTATFAVGAGHMVGETGVVALLRQAGYTVTPVWEK